MKENDESHIGLPASIKTLDDAYISGMADGIDEVVKKLCEGVPVQDIIDEYGAL